MRRAIFAVLLALSFRLHAADEGMTVIEATFDEASRGARLTSAVGVDQVGIRLVHGSVHAFANDEGEVVEGWDGLGLRFENVKEEGELRLSFSTSDVDPMVSGKLVLTLEFRMDHEDGVLAPQNFLQCTFNAPGTGAFMTWVVHGKNHRFYSTNSHTPPSHRGMLAGGVLQSGVIYQVKMIVDLTEAHYEATVMEKEGERVVYHSERRPFVTLSHLGEEGLGKNLLNLYGGGVVTVDNVVVYHRE